MDAINKARQRVLGPTAWSRVLQNKQFWTPTAPSSRAMPSANRGWISPTTARYGYASTLDFAGHITSASHCFVQPQWQPSFVSFADTSSWTKRSRLCLETGFRIDLCCVEIRTSLRPKHLDRSGTPQATSASSSGLTPANSLQGQSRRVASRGVQRSESTGAVPDQDRSSTKARAGPTKEMVRQRGFEDDSSGLEEMVAEFMTTNRLLLQEEAIA